MHLSIAGSLYELLLMVLICETSAIPRKFCKFSLQMVAPFKESSYNSWLSSINDSCFTLDDLVQNDVDTEISFYHPA